MTLRQYIITMIIGTMLCCVSLCFIIINVDPFQTNSLTFAFFYLSMFLSLLGLFSLLIFVAHRLVSRQALPLFRYVQHSFSQAVYISLFLVIMLYLQGKSWLNLWNATLLIAIFTLLISFKMSVIRKKNILTE